MLSGKHRSAAMAGTIKAFDFKIDINGAQVIAAKSFIGNACSSDQSIDDMIACLKNDLDAVAIRMKAAIKKQAFEPLWLE
jgi:hypothetical protein